MDGSGEAVWGLGFREIVEFKRRDVAAGSHIDLRAELG